jgi:ankyrin repeat protein
MNFIEACESGSLSRVKEILDRGADIHAYDDFALQLSARYGHVEVVRLLLDRGANIHADNDYALRLSAEYGHIEVVRLLLDRGANIHADDDKALRLSVWCGHVEVVRLLLDHGANIHAVNDWALRWSGKNGHVEVVRLLLDRGALLSKEKMYSITNENCIKLIRVYIHDDSLFVKQCQMIGALRRHVHSLEELCRKAILVYSGCLPDKIEEIDFELSIITLKKVYI